MKRLIATLLGLMTMPATPARKARPRHLRLEELESRMLMTALPDLVPYRPAGWAAPLVVNTNPSSRANAPAFMDSSKIDVDWAVANAGRAPTTRPFEIRVLVDGHVAGTWTDYPPQAPRFGDYDYETGVGIGRLPEGLHRLTLQVDAGNRIHETKESNNTYTCEIVVEPTPPKAIATPSASNTASKSTATVHPSTPTTSSPVPPPSAPPAPATLIPARAAYNLTLKGAVADENGTVPFEEAGVLVVTPSVLGASENAPNGRDVVLGAGGAAAGPAAGSITFVTNLLLDQLVGGTSINTSEQELANVTVNQQAGTIVVQVDPSVAQDAPLNQFSSSPNSVYGVVVAPNTYQIGAGTIQLNFTNGGQQVSGTLSLGGESTGAIYGYGIGTIQASFQGTLAPGTT